MLSLKANLDILCISSAQQTLSTIINTMLNRTITLDKKTRLSRCVLWRLQRDFYANSGVKAWLGTVPYYITSNPIIAHGYAMVISGLIRDLLRRQEYDTSQKLYIIELGTGHGRFSFYMLKQLQLLRDIFDPLGVSFQYIMSDFAKSNIEFWSSHPQIKPLLEDGMLDFAQFDAEHDTQIHLIHSNNIFGINSLNNPLVVIANYFFDSIPHDSYHVDAGKFYEALPRVTTSSRNIKNKKPIDTSKINIDFDYVETDPSCYYDDPHLNAVLKYYQETLKKPSTPLVPYAGIQCINRLKKISNNKLLLITSDKAYSYLHEIDGLKNPGAYANGGFFPMVNFHCMHEYFTRAGAQSIVQSYRKGLKTCAVLIGLPKLDDELPETRLAIKEHIEDLSPVDAFNIYREFKKNKKSVELASLASLFQFCHWDPHVFNFFHGRVIETIANADETLRRLFDSGLKKIIQNYYYMPNNQNIPFEVGLVFHTMNNHQQAINHYLLSIDYFGKHFSVLYNCALCYYLLDQPQEALTLFTESLTFEDSDKAKEWVERITQEMNPESS